MSEWREKSDDALAARLATWTGRLLVDVRDSTVLSGTALGAAGDAIAHRFLVAALAAARPGQAVLSEEAPDDRERLDRRTVWIVDPLDGTREYGEGRDDFAVHVALVRDGEAVVGAVALPAPGFTYSTGNALELHDASARPLRIVDSRTRPPAFVEHMAEALGAEIVTMGSMGAKTMAVLRGEADAYVHAGGYHEWDAAAPVAVAPSCWTFCDTARWHAAALQSPGPVSGRPARVSASAGPASAQRGGRGTRRH